MKLYVIVPHRWNTWDDVTMFTTFSAVEQVALAFANRRIASGEDPDWCQIVAYDGQDELYPVFLYRFFGNRLHREPWPTPSP